MNSKELKILNSILEKQAKISNQVSQLLILIESDIDKLKTDVNELKEAEPTPR
jgi:hypothetical protein